MRPSTAYGALVAAAVAVMCQPTFADDLQTFEIVLKDHAFSPAEIHVPTGKPFIVVVKNESDQADEFEMLIPSVEHGVQGNGETKFRVRPLIPGRFPFFGESDPDNEKGAIVSE
jgi:hypothetical protein